MNYSNYSKSPLTRVRSESNKISLHQYRARNKQQCSIKSDKKTEQGIREVQKILQEEGAKIPGLAEDDKVDPSFSTDRIFMPSKKFYSQSKPDEPEIFTLSSDDEDSNNEPKPKLLCPKEPIITRNMSMPDIPDQTEDKCQDQLNINCRKIRIGSYKFVPIGFVECSKRSFKFSCAVPRFEEDSNIQVHIPLNSIVKLLCHFGFQFPTIIVYVTPKYAEHLRKMLCMSEGQEPYFDPCSSDESHKRIILLIQKIGEDVKTYFKNAYNRIGKWHYGGPLLEEIDKDDANKILMSSSPEQPQFIGKSTSTSETSKTLLVYPRTPTKGRITITTADYDCLGEEEFLNDVILDFYLKWLHAEKLPEVQRSRTHIFSTFFYKRLTAKPKGRPEPTNLPAAQRRHARVKSWTKGVNIFEKDFVVVPINEKYHWFLVVICFPGMELSNKQVNPIIKSVIRSSIRNRNKLQFQNEISLDGDASDRDEADSDEELDSLDDPVASQLQEANYNQPCILVFDSLHGSSRSRIVATLREYLSVEYQEKMGKPKKFTKENMEGHLPSVPQQYNYSDCGIYTLQFAESFFDSPIKDFRLPIKPLNDWFSQDIITGKREAIANLITALMKNDNRNMDIVPTVKFSSSLPPLEDRSEEMLQTNENKRKCDDLGEDDRTVNPDEFEKPLKKINLNLSSKTIAINVKKATERVMTSFLPNSYPNSLDIIKKSYDECDEDDEQKASDSRDTDLDIYDDLDPVKDSKKKRSSDSSISPLMENLETKDNEDIIVIKR